MGQAMGHRTGSPGPCPSGPGPGEQGALLDAPHSAERRLRVPGVDNPVARVILDSVVPHLDRTFDYTVPLGLDKDARPGTRVIVRFGGQEMRGWVWSRASTTTHLGTLSAVRRVVSDLPVLPEASRRLIDAVAARTAGTRRTRRRSVMADFTEDGIDRTTTLKVSGLTCGHCVAHITEELEAIEGVKNVSILLNKEGQSTVTVVSDVLLSDGALKAAIDEAGDYTLDAIERDS